MLHAERLTQPQTDDFMQKLESFAAEMVGKGSPNGSVILQKADEIGRPLKNAMDRSLTWHIGDPHDVLRLGPEQISASETSMAKKYAPLAAVQNVLHNIAWGAARIDILANRKAVREKRAPREEAFDQAIRPALEKYVTPIAESLANDFMDAKTLKEQIKWRRNTYGTPRLALMADELMTSGETSYAGYAPAAASEQVEAFTARCERYTALSETKHGDMLDAVDRYLDEKNITDPKKAALELSAPGFADRLLASEAYQGFRSGVLEMEDVSHTPTGGFAGNPITVLRAEQVKQLLAYIQDVPAREAKGEQLIPEISAFVRAHHDDLKLLVSALEENEAKVTASRELQEGCAADWFAQKQAQQQR